LGTYTVSIEPSQVSDTGGSPAYVVAGTGVQFTVAIPTVFTVTNANDSGNGSLRQAIIDANANPGLDTINFDAGFFSRPQSIQVLFGQMVISDSVTINGPAAANLVTLNNIAANSTTSRLFNIAIPGALVPVSISNLTFNGGNASTGGGAIAIADD